MFSKRLFACLILLAGWSKCGGLSAAGGCGVQLAEAHYEMFRLYLRMGGIEERSGSSAADPSRALTGKERVIADAYRRLPDLKAV